MKRLVTKILLLCVLASLLQGALPMHAYAAPQPAVTYDSFDFQRYADDYEDLKRTFGYEKKQLWNHYINSGFAEGRTVYLTNGTPATLPAVQPGVNRATFDHIRYADDYQDLKNAFGYDRENLWRHFVDYGASEGRSAYIRDVRTDVMRAMTKIRLADAFPKVIAPVTSDGTLPSYWSTREYTEQELQLIRNYYGTTLFIGDSVMSGFGMVCAGSADPLLKSFHFMAAPSYGLAHALNEKSGGLHPPYRGKRIPPWQVVSSVRPDTVFLFLGINDISYTSLDNLISKYRQLIAKITEVRPGVRIIVMSATYPYPGINKGGLNGDNIAAYNLRLQQMAIEDGLGFIDIAATSKGDGNFMKPELSSDRYVHVQFSVYNDWAKAIKAWAWQQVSGE